MGWLGLLPHALFKVYLHLPESADTAIRQTSHNAYIKQSCPWHFCAPLAHCVFVKPINSVYLWLRYLVLKTRVRKVLPGNTPTCWPKENIQQWLSRGVMSCGGIYSDWFFPCGLVFFRTQGKWAELCLFIFRNSFWLIRFWGNSRYYQQWWWCGGRPYPKNLFAPKAPQVNHPRVSILNNSPTNAL